MFEALQSSPPSACFSLLAFSPGRAESPPLNKVSHHRISPGKNAALWAVARGPRWIGHINNALNRCTGSPAAPFQIATPSILIEYMLSVSPSSTSCIRPWTRDLPHTTCTLGFAAVSSASHLPAALLLNSSHKRSNMIPIPRRIVCPRTPAAYHFVLHLRWPPAALPASLPFLAPVA